MDIYNINMNSSNKNMDLIFSFKFQNKDSKPKIINLMNDKFLIFFDNNTFVYIINTNSSFDIYKGNLENFKNPGNDIVSLRSISKEKYFIIIKDKEGIYKAITLNPKLNKSSMIKFDNENSIEEITLDNDLFYVIRKSGSKSQYTIEPFYFKITEDDIDIKSLKLKNIDLFNNDKIKAIKGKFDLKYENGNLLVLTNFNHIKNILIENEVSL